MPSLARNTMIYGVGVILSRAVGFLMLPVYTRFLSPGDYGVLTLLQMTTDVTAILLSAGTTAGVLRFYFKATTDRGRHAVIDTALTLLAVLNGIGAALLVVGAPTIAAVVFKGEAGPDLIRIAAGSFFLEAFIIVPLLFAQAQERATLYVGVSFIKLVLQLGLNLLFLVGFGWGVRGVLLANLTASVVVGGALTIWTFRQTGYHVDRATVRDLRRFGVPYQFVTAGTFILTFGDRFFLQAFHGVEAVGLYGLAYQFGFVLMSLGALPLLQAWNPQRFQQVTEPKAVRDAHYNAGFLVLSLIVISLAVGIGAFIKPVLRLMSDAAFHPAAAFVPPILLAYIIQAWMDVVQFGIDVSERTKYATLATWIGVVTILLLYVVLIPPYGAMGAALATVGGFAIRFAFYYRFAQRLWPIDYHWTPHLLLLALGGLCVAVVWVAAPTGFWGETATASVGVACYAAVVWWVVLRRADRQRVRSIIADLLGRLRGAGNATG